MRPAVRSRWRPRSPGRRKRRGIYVVRSRNLRRTGIDSVEIRDCFHQRPRSGRRRGTGDLLPVLPGAPRGDANRESACVAAARSAELHGDALAEARRCPDSLDELADTPDAHTDPEREVQSAQTAPRMRAVLSPRELECVQLRIEGMRYDEIGSLLKVESGTVGATLARAMKKLKSMVKRECAERGICCRGRRNRALPFG